MQHLILIYSASDTVSIIGTLMIPIMFIGGIVLLVTGIIYYGYKKDQERRKGLQMFASQNGWTLVPTAYPSQFQNSQHYSIFTKGRSRAILGLLQKPIDGGQMMVFDYRYTVSTGKNSHTYTQTVFAFHTPHLNVPYFSLYPEEFLSFIGEMFGFNDIDFASHPVFSKRFKLSGQDEMPIRQIFHPQVLTAFESMPGVNVDAGGNYFFIYNSGQQVSIEHLSGFINTATNVYGLFRR